MSLWIVSAEIISFLFLVIILLSLRANENNKSTDNRLFLALTLSASAGLIFDSLSYLLIRYPMGNVIMILANVLAFCTIDFCIVLFSFYMMTLIQKNVRVSFKPIYPVIAVSTLNFILIIIGTFNGRFFSVINHDYVYGSWYASVTDMPVISLIIVLFILIFHSKDLGKRNTVVLASFVLCPIIAAVILFFIPDYGLGYLATALSCAIIFTFIRREEVNEAHNREQIIREVIALDVLTGLLNRRGFNEAVEEALRHETLGIVFCDLNALKYTNDNFGHEAGDAYIRKFADILKQVFGGLGPICRISGDEFAVLLYDISKERFDELKTELNRAIKENDRIASAGYAYGDTDSPMKLLGIAEQEMYTEKGRFYTETGLDRRKGRFRQFQAQE